MKSSRGGYLFDLTVTGSSFEYTYNYSFKENDWMVVYDNNAGYSIYVFDQHIVFDEEVPK